MDNEELVSYAHKGDPSGVRFCQYKSDPLPQWATNVQPYDPSKEVEGLTLEKLLEDLQRITSEKADLERELERCRSTIVIVQSKE